jgi:carboxylate-amine ligase
VRRADSRELLSVGVEEEFVLVDARTGRVVNRAPEVLADAAERDSDLQAEIARYQVESATAVCRTTVEVRDQLARARTDLVDLAARHGARLVATGTPVLGDSLPAPLTRRPRYHRMAEEYGTLTNDLAICGCHVHVGLPDDEAKVLVSNHLRPWLPTLLALSANSPYWNERDTGYASWRYVVWGRWPSAGPPPWLASAAEYYALRDVIVTSGAALDPAMLYWDVRLSAAHPTLELRVCDVAATAEEAALIAAVVRALATTALASSLPPPAVPQHLLKVALWRAARDGLEGLGVDPLSGALVPAADLVASLLATVRPALEAAGDHELVSDGVDRLLLDGSGAARQRRAFSRRGRLEDVVGMLVAQTNPL